MFRKSLVLFLLFLLLIPAQAQAQITAIRAGKVIDSESGKTDANQIILIEKGKITAIGSGLTMPAGAVIIDLSRFTVLPGPYKIGVPLAYGSDAIDAEEGQTRGTLAISGIGPWIEAGIPAQALLKAMTIDAARLLGVDKDRGLIRVGLAADIIATTENPLENANALRRVSFVMKKGVVIKKVE